ncbi:hypothetical protein [Nocardia farcinica]|uniref:hypothetical protein n=1 Tax=Nocardia farcinica TaxID=37329 RepID=UPI002455BF41|nr:hypothetical protein [Nocardia farcinica]
MSDLRCMSAASGFDPRAEVEAVHRLLATWLGTDADPQVLDGFLATQHEDFSMVTVDGAVLGRKELRDGLRGARNSLPGLVIEISELEMVWHAGGLVVVRFVEGHRSGGAVEFRRTTAVLAADPGRRDRWLALQETAIAPRADRA